MAFAGQATTVNEDHGNEQAGELGSVYGNHTAENVEQLDHDADTNNNTVTMTGGKVYGGVYGAVIGEYDISNRSAAGNQVTVSGGTIDGGGSGALAGAVAEAFNAAHNVENNSVTVSGTAVIHVDIDGALTNNGTANNNHVRITGGNVNGGVSKKICGGCSNYGGDATNNTVTISGGTVNVGGIYGGYLGEFLMAGSNLTGKATGNQVIINGANVTAGAIYGGFRVSGNPGDGAAVTNNTVTLNDATVTGSVWGGYCNNDNYNGTVDIITGNTLNLSGANTVSGTVKNFATVNLKSAAWGTPVLKLTSAGMAQNNGGTKAKIDASTLAFANPETIANGDTMTLIECVNGAAIVADLAATTAKQEYTVNPASTPP